MMPTMLIFRMNTSLEEVENLKLDVKQKKAKVSRVLTKQECLIQLS